MSKRSIGVTETERLLAKFCESTFLKLWSYPNPFKDDGHELCDLLAVFGDDVFIFFDRENVLPEESDKDPQVLWDRWRRNVIDRQVKTAHGAERYLRLGRPVYVDGKRAQPFPIGIDPAKANIHKIIVAHGAKDACKNASPMNVYGSLAITYSDMATEPTVPFHLDLERASPVHVLDSHNMPIVLGELDTITDLSRYFREKTRAISRYAALSYCGEEDLLAHYLYNFDSEAGQYLIGTRDEDVLSIHIGEGEWATFVESTTYQNTKRADKISYFWDDLIQRTCQNSLDGTLGGNSNIARGESAIFEMVKEPRFMRRALSERMLTATERFPDQPSGMTRQVTFLPSFHEDVGYVLLQLRMPEALRAAPDFRDKRQFMLEIACGAAKNKFDRLSKVVGIGIENPKFVRHNTGEDFILMPCAEWPAEQRLHYEKLNEHLNFFGTDKLQQFNERVTQFVNDDDQPASRRPGKIGRNEKCPCGSGKKFKHCHGR